MTYEDYCKIEGIEENPAEKKCTKPGSMMLQMTLHLVFGIATGTLEEDRFLKRLAKAVDYES